MTTVFTKFENYTNTSYPDPVNDMIASSVNVVKDTTASVASNTIYTIKEIAKLPGEAAKGLQSSLQYVAIAAVAGAVIILFRK